MAQQRRRATSGFTLIEMMVTLTVVVILLGITVPSFRQLIANQRIKTASFDLFAALNYARSEAIKRNGNVTLRAGASIDGAWTTGWRLVDSSSNLLRSWPPPPSLTVSNTATGAATALTYGAEGRLTTGSVAPKLQVDPSVAVSGVIGRCVGLDLSGRPTTKVGACS